MMIQKKNRHLVLWVSTFTKIQCFGKCLLNMDTI